MPKTATRLITCFLLTLLLPLISPGTLPAAPAVELELSAEAAVLIEVETGTVLYAKNAEKRMYPASVTKIMTLLLALEELERGTVNWDTMVTVSQRAWEVSNGGRTSSMFLNINQQVSFEDLVRGIAVVSANDACVAVAEYLYGSVSAFAQEMNQRAAELGMENTHFVNPHGLHDPEHYTTALDLARLGAFFMRTRPEALPFLTEREFTFNEITQYNLNPLLGIYPGADGIKTGSTPEAGYCLVGSAEQEGMRLVSVVLNSPGFEARGQDSEVLLNHGFRHYQMVTLYEAGETVASVPVKRAQKEELELVAADAVRVLSPRDDSGYKIEQRLTLPESVEAPVKEGDRIGVLSLINPDGETAGEVDLFASETLERLGFFPSLLRAVGSFFSNLWQSIWPGAKD